MEIHYATRRLEIVCTDYKVAKSKHGQTLANKIHLRIQQITSFETFSMLLESKVGRIHRLTGNRDGQYAMHLTANYRLILEEVDHSVSIVKIIEIVDYH